MFTGIIKYVCEYTLIDSVLVLYIKLDKIDVGQSIAVNGVCLTITEICDEYIKFFVMEETLKITKFENTNERKKANVELSLKNDSSIDGHYVSGHVSTVGVIEKIISNNDKSTDIWIKPKDESNNIKYKDSIAIDGTSLTVAELKDNMFRVSVIPHTYKNTIIQYYSEGDAVNIEYNNEIINKDDEYYMNIAIKESKKGRSTTYPNPWVGCVIVKDNIILGTGYHERAGYDHAEINVLNKIKDKSELVNSTMYVTLEPCCHTGKTPPCINSIIEHGIKRIVIGMLDPDEKVSGRSVDILKRHNIIVKVGICNKKIKKSLRSYIYHRKNGLPYCVAKIGISINGCYSIKSKEQYWITNEISRKHSNKLLYKSQAIIVGATTFNNDYDKLKNNFLEDENNKPLRVILDAYGDPDKYKGVDNILVFQSDDNKKTNSKNIKYVKSSIDGKLNLFEILDELKKIDILQCSIYGGAIIHASFFEAGLIQELHIYRSSNYLDGINWYEYVNLSGYELKLIKRKNMDRTDVYEKYTVKKKPVVEKIQKILNDVRNGKPVIIMDSEDRENEGDLFVGADFMNEEMTNKFIQDGTGILCVSMTEMKSLQLDLPLMVTNNEDNNHTNFTVTFDLKESKTGVSALERSNTINKIASTECKRKDLAKPGHMQGLVAEYGNLRLRKGHTEASVVLCKLAGIKQVGCIVELMNKDGKMMNYDDCKKYGKMNGYEVITIENIEEYINIMKPRIFGIESSADIELDKYGKWKVLTYHSNTYDDFSPHIVLMKGNVYDVDEVYTRIHSECFTGDVLGSKQCDCGEQLHKSLKIINDKRNGLIIFPSNHEGRSIGFVNKILSYRLQNTYNYNTFEANRKLGFEDDHRSYKEVKYILKSLNIKKIKLLSENPGKIEGLKEYINSVNSLVIDHNDVNENYIKEKRNKYKNKKKIEEYNETKIYIDRDMSKDRILILSTSWHKENINKIVKDITMYLEEYKIEKIKNIEVPGCFDMISTINNKHNKYDIIICCGALLNGETDHYKYTSKGVMQGLIELQIKLKKPIINGIFNCHNEQQIIDKCKSNSGAARSFAHSTIQMLQII